MIGSGIAGMSFALKVASKGKVALICKTTLDEANTALAQGGVASVTNLEVDDFEKHINDTMIAGDWLSDPEAVRKVVTELPDRYVSLSTGALTSTRRKTAASTSTAKAATRSSASSTMPTTPDSRSRNRSSRLSGRTPTSTSSNIILPSRSSPSTIWAR